MHLRTLVESSAKDFPEQTAFQIKKDGKYQKLTYRQAKEAVDSLASFLLSSGIKKGDRVAIHSENRPEWAIAYFAVTSISAVAVPIDIMLGRSEIMVLLLDCEAKAIINSSRAREQFGEKLSLLEIQMENLPEDMKGLPQIEYNQEDLAAIVYTSGTTGNSKGVMLSHINIVSNAAAVASLFDLGPGDNFLSVLPLHHTFETTAGFLAPFHLGCTITCAESLKSHNLISNMQETGVTVMCGVPLLYQLFYDGIMREVEGKGKLLQIIFSFLMKLAGLFKNQSVRRKLFPMIHKKMGGKINFFVSGGAAIDPQIIKGFDLFGITILQGYGLTESAPILTCNTMENNKIGAVGKALPNVEIKIREDGEIIARGPNIMRGYYKRLDLTAEILKDGWLYTGDIGRVDPEGYLFITGRSKDVIVPASGVNVYPDELEFKIQKIKGVKDVCVLGRTIKSTIRAGSEEVLAIIQPDAPGLEEHIKSAVFFLNEQLADYKRIAEVIFREEDFPKTTTKKIKKFQVKKEMRLI